MNRQGVHVIGRKSAARQPAVVLLELLIVLAIMTLLTGTAMLAFTPAFTRAKFESRAQDIVRVFEMAYSAAKQSDRRYAVRFDVMDQFYDLREYSPLEPDEFDPEEDIITTGYFDEDFQLDYVQFDDGSSTLEMEGDRMAELTAEFRAGRGGWQYGGKVVILDGEGMPYSIVVNRITGKVDFYAGDVGILTEQYQDNVLF